MIDCKKGRRVNEDAIQEPNAGFTLVEAMVVLAVFTIGVLAVGSLQTRSVITNSSARSGTHACALAAERMEILIGLAYDDHGLRDSNQDGVAGLDACTLDSADGSDAGNPPYTVCWNVAQVPIVFNPETINYKQVRVIVTWQARGALRRCALTCYRTDS